MGETWIKPPRVYMCMYVKRITRKRWILLPWKGVRKISSVACGLSPIKIHFFWLSEKIYQQNNGCVCFNNLSIYM